VKIFYTVIVNNDNLITEISGVVSAKSLDVARTCLAEQGFTIRELREATAQEVYLHRLKKLRHKLTGDRKLVRMPLPPSPLMKAAYWRCPIEVVVLVVVVLIVILCCYLGV
jgi:hypothetical protein